MLVHQETLMADDRTRERPILEIHKIEVVDSTIFLQSEIETLIHSPH